MRADAIVEYRSAEEILVRSYEPELNAVMESIGNGIEQKIGVRVTYVPEPNCRTKREY
jgi:hypothetical protein